MPCAHLLAHEEVRKSATSEYRAYNKIVTTDLFNANDILLKLRLDAGLSGPSDLRYPESALSYSQ